MSEPLDHVNEGQGPPSSPSSAAAVGKIALLEANRHRDALYTSLAGVAAIVVVLLAALSLPVFHFAPISSPFLFLVMVLASCGGVGALCIINVVSHQNVVQQARLTEVLLNSLGQGFLSFGADGRCGPVFSQACIELLECKPAGRDVVDIFRLTKDQASDFRDWLGMLFATDNALSFDDVIKFFPQTFMHGKGRYITLSYRPLYGSAKNLLSIVMIATDETEEAEAALRARAQQNYVNMISRIFRERNQFLVTVTHLRKFIEDSKHFVEKTDSSSILRLLHTLKAAVKHFHLDALDEIITRLEMDLHNPALFTDVDFNVRLLKGGEEVAACLKELMAQLSDMIGHNYEGQGSMHEVDDKVIYDFARVLRARGVGNDLVREYLLAIAAEPINEAFRQFDREMKDLAEITGKRVKPVRFTGTNPKVLMQPLEPLLLSVMHICRNIIDHGIEPAVTRLARGKDPSGQVTIHTEMIEDEETGRLLHIVISDDGNGIDPASVRAKLAKIDPGGEWQHEDDVAVIQRILLWQVSTKDEVSALSGRGVGMEAVDREVRALGGTIMVSSVIYQSTTFDVYIPYNIDTFIKE